MLGGASPHVSAARRVARNRRRLPWGSFPLDGLCLGLLIALTFLISAAPLRVPPPRSESAAASWLCFMPHPPTGFCLQGFSQPSSRTPLGAVAPLPLESAIVKPSPFCAPLFPARLLEVPSAELSSSLLQPGLNIIFDASSQDCTAFRERLRFRSKRLRRFRLNGWSPQEPRLRQVCSKAWTPDFGALLHSAIRTAVSE
jgi:hypothetical protein